MVYYLYTVRDNLKRRRALYFLQHYHETLTLIKNLSNGFLVQILVAEYFEYQFKNPNLKTITPLNYDQRHTITTTFDYRYGEGKNYNGPVVGKNKKPIFANTGLDVIFTGGSGTPYTRQSNPTPQGLSGVASQSSLQGTLNGARLPWTFRFDLKLDKNFRIGKEGNETNPFYINGYILIENALNTKNVLGVYSYTGNPDDDGYLSSAIGQQSLEAQLSREAYLDQYAIRINNPGNYTLPRRIRCGLSFDF